MLLHNPNLIELDQPAMQRNELIKTALGPSMWALDVG